VLYLDIQNLLQKFDQHPNLDIDDLQMLLGRDGQYTIFEVYGVYCIHPNNNNIGLFIQLSRKAPFDQKNQLFKQLGQDLLDSIVFNIVYCPSLFAP
jgi:hypothetical protein